MVGPCCHINLVDWCTWILFCSTVHSLAKTSGKKGGPMKIYARIDDPVEFGRVVALVDGVFAIALTLLVLDLALPTQIAEVPLTVALADAAPRFLAFAISVAVVGTFFQIHHENLSMLQKVDSSLLWLTVPYLGLIVLIPFMQSILSSRPAEPLAFALYAIVLGFTSAIGAFMVWHAHRHGLLRKPLLGQAAQFEALRNLLPIFLFFSSTVLAFLIGRWTILIWVSLFPLDAIFARLQRRGSSRIRIDTGDLHQDSSLR